MRNRGLEPRTSRRPFARALRAVRHRPRASLIKVAAARAKTVENAQHPRRRPVAPCGRSATIMATRARGSLAPLAASPARSLRADDRTQRAQRERNPFDREPVRRDPDRLRRPRPRSDPWQRPHLRGAGRPPRHGTPMGPCLARLARCPPFRPRRPAPAPIRAATPGRPGNRVLLDRPGPVPIGRATDPASGTAAPDAPGRSARRIPNLCRGTSRVSRPGRGRGGDRDPDAEVLRVRDHERAPRRFAGGGRAAGGAEAARDARPREGDTGGRFQDTRPGASHRRRLAEGRGFYARFGISEAQFRHGVRDAEVSEDADLGDSMWSRVDRVAEVRAREAAVLPRVEWSYG